MNYLIAVDMEGVHGVQGEPYHGQEPYFAIGKDTREYFKAVVSATEEVNTAAKALFDSGAESVYLWDNHGGRDNLFLELVDSRVKKVDPPKEMKTRLNFLREINVSGIVFIGYHSREGSLNGVLSHTYNGIAYQYVKVDGKTVGELEFDSTIAATYGVPALFAASDDVCIGQVKEYDPRVVTVITKIGKGRTLAEYRPAEVVLSEIYEGVLRAAGNVNKPLPVTFPKELEVRYSRTETAAYFYEMRKEIFGDRLCYGEDAHILKTTANNVDEMRLLL